MKRTLLISLILGTVLVIAPAAQAVLLAPEGGGSASTASAGKVAMTPFQYRTLMTRSEALNKQAGSTVGMTKAEYKALMIRSEALNKQYGNAVTALTPAQFAALYNAGADRLSPQEFNALVARSQGLDEKYGLGSSGITLRPDVLGGNGGTATTQLSPTGSNSFDWGNLTIGAVSLTAVILLAIATLAITRRRRVLSF